MSEIKVILPGYRYWMAVGSSSENPRHDVQLATVISKSASGACLVSIPNYPNMVVNESVLCHEKKNAYRMLIQAYKKVEAEYEQDQVELRGAISLANIHIANNNDAISLIRNRVSQVLKLIG